MERQKELRGIELRYMLTVALANGGAMTVADLAYELDRLGFSVSGRPSKAISDALRWEVNRGRVSRFEHGSYGPGYIPRSTEYRIRQRVAELKRRPRATDDSDDDEWWASL